MRIVDKLFVDHPASVDETYLEHMHVASSFGIVMILGGIACLIHGLIPCLFEKTGSNVIRHLHEKMVSNRVRHRIAEKAQA